MCVHTRINGSIPRKLLNLHNLLYHQLIVLCDVTIVCKSLAMLIYSSYHALHGMDASARAAWKFECVDSARANEGCT